jgi:hypothetical protein
MSLLRGIQLPQWDRRVRLCGERLRRHRLCRRPETRLLIIILMPWDTIGVWPLISRLPMILLIHLFCHLD